MADISKLKLPDGTTYDLKDSYVRTNYRALSNNDFDTINVTELNAGDLIVTGAARFLNTINGSISGNAVTATKATQDESGNNIKATYAASFSISDHTITLKNKNGVSLGTVTVPDNATDNTKLPLAGGTMTGELINQKGGIWVQGGSAAGGNVDRMTLTSGMPTELKYNSSKRGLRLYSNAIAIADPYNGNSNNDAGWLRHIEETSNIGVLELAVGDDGNESIVMRQYNTSSAIIREAKILDTNGTTSFPVSVTAPKFIGALQGNADTATKATQDSDGNTINSTYYKASNPNGYTTNTGTITGIKMNGASKGTSGVVDLGTVLTAHQDISGKVNKSGDTMSGALTVEASNSYSSYNEGIRINAGARTYATLLMGGTNGTTSGTNDGAFWLGVYNTGTTARRLMIAHNGSTNTGTYFYASSSSDISPSLRVGSNLQVANVISANVSNSGTAGGISLFSTDPTSYGIAMRNTTNSGKHGYVQGDWGTYFYMAGATNRGWVFCNAGSGNRMSISNEGHIVTNGSLTLGGNTTNTSGVRQVYNSTTKSLDFVFVA